MSKYESSYKALYNNRCKRRIGAVLLLNIFLFNACAHSNLKFVPEDSPTQQKDLSSDVEGKAGQLREEDSWEFEDLNQAKSTRSINDVDLAHLYSTLGFEMWNYGSYDRFGYSVSQAGDINNDGIDDIIIGAYRDDPNFKVSAGSSYVIYGKPGGYNINIDMSYFSPTIGFQINGNAAYDFLGASVSYAGDINNDSIDDIIVGAYGASPNNKLQAGASYVIYGKPGGYNAPIDLSSLPSTVGFQINGAATGDFLGTSVSHAGDINKDGVDDVIIGAYGASPNGKNSTGSSYVIYGKLGGYNTSIDLSNLSLTDGFQINGATAGDMSGYSVSHAGDVNKDGIDDVIIGAYGASPTSKIHAGSSYVIYGKLGGYNTSVDLSSLSSTVGFQINGATAGDYAGYSVSQGGDVNKDGIGDVIIGAPYTAPNNRAYAGASYVIYGKQGGYNTSIDLSNLSSTVGFQINGGTQSGYSVSQAGDINQDGIDDIIIGAYTAGPNLSSGIGSGYVVYGKVGGYNTSIDLTNLPPTDGFRLNNASGGSPSNFFGVSVSQAGDVNQDGIDDIIIGAYGACLGSGRNIKKEVGASYVIYGFIPPIPTPAISSVSSLRPSWLSLNRWWESLKFIYFQPAVEPTLTSEASELVKLHAKCKRLIQEADSKTADKWYRFSLEDLQENIAAMLKQPGEITGHTVKQYITQLEGIEKDFLKEPLLEKPSFFAGMRNRVEVDSFGMNNEGTLLQPTMMPMLGAGHIPSAIGN